jgi:cell surface protein SprA
LQIRSSLLVDPFKGRIPSFSLLDDFDALVYPRGLIKIRALKPVRQVQVDQGWDFITITESIFGRVFLVPFTAPLEWYVFESYQQNRIRNFEEQVNKMVGKETEDQKRKERGRALELVGVDLGQFGRASLRVNGNVNISGKMIFQDQEQIRSSITESQTTQFKIDQTQHLNIEGTIGDRISVNMDQDSERDFDWENNIRVSYQGKEDEIIQAIEAGNISLSLPATQYVTFSGQNQGLFGLKGLAKLGPIDITAVASVERTRKERQEYKGNSQPQTQVIKDYDYIKNQYFFIHEWFRNGIDVTVDNKAIRIFPFYPLDAEGLHTRGNIKITNFELYKLDLTNNPGVDVGVAYIDPSDPDSFGDDNQSGNFLRLERNVDYFVSEDLGFIKMKSFVQDQILACHYTLVDRISGDTLLVVGRDITTDETLNLSLQMLKPRSPHPNHPTWDLMFKNVYYLGSTNINKEGFSVNIVNNHLSPPSPRDKNGVTYLTHFSLDTESENGAPVPDELIDINNSNIINLIDGEIHFPVLLPFVSSDSLEGGNLNSELNKALGSGKMYSTTIFSQYSGDSRFTIEANYSNPSSTINLGFMVVEGSEEVYRGGNQLLRGTDYRIDYLSGTIIMISEIEDPNAEIRILYDKHELVSFDKKVIMGSRAQMDLGPRSFIGATALYYNQSVINKKVEVGYEPTRNFIWDVNGRYETNLGAFTQMLDRLPFIETEETSVFSIEGEFAQVIPNPNPISNAATGDPNGVAFIDDFEGAKRSTNPVIMRRFWKESSAPLDSTTGLDLNQRYRARLIWYNPYNKVATRTIWPNLSTSTRAANTTTDILVLNYTTRSHQAGVGRDSLWAGITTSFHSGDFDQTQSKFFEIWLRVRGDEGKLMVDMGKISEDRNGDNVLNTEDIPQAGLPIGNTVLDPGEDKGIDGCTDEYENGWGGCLNANGPTYGEYFASGEQELINIGIDVDAQDPNGDNWYYSEGSSDYSKVNGTEGNGSGAQQQAGGKYPDTEDLDRTGYLDITNDYFTNTIVLNDTTYLAGITEDNGNPTGWRLYRVPLSHFRQIRSIEWNEIQTMRLVWSGVDSTSVLEIAKIEIVGNDWQELGVAADTSEIYMKKDSTFAIAVINTEDDASYRPPKGVKGEYDPINEIRSKEQSLVLKFIDLPGGYKAAATKTLLSLSGDRAQSFLTYDRLKMYVYGESHAISVDQTDVELFMRFGLGDNYYEVSQPVYTGWDEEQGRNSIDIDLSWLTRLKQQNSETVDKLRNTDTFIDSADVKKYLFTDTNGEPDRRQVLIKGSPALSRLQYFTIGIRNVADIPIKGEVWIDELRLSGVKKDRGIAMRVQTKLKMADLGNTTIMFSRKDANFHILQQRLGTQSTNEDFRINSSFQIHKLFPKSWGIIMPFTASISNTVNKPKYLPGTDVLITGKPPDSTLTRSNRISLGTAISKPGKSENKWIRYTLDNITGSFNTSRVVNSNVIMREVRNESYSGRLAYSHTFGRDNHIKPFKWLRFIPAIGSKISETNIYYTPASINTSMDFAEKLVQKESRSGGRVPDEYNLGLNRILNIVYKLTDNVETRYGWNAKSDLDEIRGYAWTAIRDLDPGVVTNVTENFQANYNPNIGKWLRPNFTYTSAYRWAQPLSSSIDGANIGTQIRFTTNLSINPVALIDAIIKPKETREPELQPRQRLNLEEEADIIEQDENSEQGSSVREKRESGRKKRNRTVNLIKKISSVNITYTENLNRSGLGVQGTVPTGYKFGWLPDHGLKHSEKIGVNTGGWQFKRTMTVRSSISLIKTAKLNVNFTQDVTDNRSGSGVNQQSITRDYLSYGNRLENGFPFAGWSFQMTGFEDWPILKLFAKSASLEHAYNGNEARSYKIEGAQDPNIKFFSLGSFIDDNEDNLIQSRVISSFSPLVGFTISIGKGISINIRNNLSTTLNEVRTGITLRKDKSWSISSNYNHRGGLKIPLPFLDDFRIRNTMNFMFNLDSNNAKTWGSKTKEDFAQLSKSSSWKAGMRISYSFSTRVSGGIVLEYRESDSDIVGKKVNRDIGIDINIAISG